MKTWYKLRNGAFFVDLVLIIMAIIAIIGLATFVHFRDSKRPAQPNLRDYLTTYTSHLDNLATENGGNLEPPTSNTDAAPTNSKDNTGNTSLQSTGSLPESEVDKATHCGISCNVGPVVNNTGIATPVIVTPIIPTPTGKDLCKNAPVRALASVIAKELDNIECPLTK